MSFSRTVIVSCAGMGNRLGLKTTKALLEIEGKPLIIRHLEMLGNETDIRVVVGYQAEKVIEVVNKYRNDVVFVFNHKYKETGTGSSVALASKYANDYILSLDGDIIVHPEDMKKILACKYEFVSGNMPYSEEPWMLQTYTNSDDKWVSNFSKNIGNYEWNGITQMKSCKMQNGSGHVFQLIEPYLPIRFMEVRTREIDTINDYESAIKWIKSDFIDEKR